MLTAIATTVGNTLTSETDVNGRHTLTTDELVAIGGEDQGRAPHELLPAMLAACVATMIALYAQKRDWRLGPVQVDVSYDTDTTPRQIA